MSRRLPPKVRALLVEAKACDACREPWECGDCGRSVSGLLGWCPRCSGKRIPLNTRSLLEKHLEHLLSSVRE